jgi:hypothetical protein
VGRALKQFTHQQTHECSRVRWDTLKRIELDLSDLIEVMRPADAEKQKTVDEDWHQNPRGDS